MESNARGIYRILAVEDDVAFQSAIAAALPKEIVVESALNTREAREKLERARFDLILLDLTLPDGDGMRFFSSIRADERFQEIPVIFVTGRDDVEEKVLAFSLGADDYLVKPFHAKEFRARVLARLKKNRQTAEAGSVFRLGSFRFLVPMQQVHLDLPDSSRKIDVSPLEFRLLLLLARNEGRVFSRDELINRVWGENVHVLDRTVDSHISDLRKKLPAVSHQIQAVRGEGYRLVPADAASSTPPKSRRSAV